VDGSLVPSLSESGLGLATTRIGRCGLLRGATDLASSAIEFDSIAKERLLLLERWRPEWTLQYASKTFGTLSSSADTRSRLLAPCLTQSFDGLDPGPETKTTPNVLI
jgi:hypothetical protein